MDIKKLIEKLKKKVDEGYKGSTCIKNPEVPCTWEYFIKTQHTTEDLKTFREGYIKQGASPSMVSDFCRNCLLAKTLFENESLGSMLRKRFK